MKPSEIFEGENSGLRKAFDEAVAREQSHIDQGKAGIDENLKSMNNGMVFNPNNMNDTEKILAEFDEWIKIKRTEDVDFHYGVGPWVVTELRAFLTTSIAQAEKSGKDQMREELGCICKNLAPASVHFKDCPLGKCTQALAEERKRVRERVGELTIYRNNKGVTEIEENTGYYKANEITSSLDKIKEI